MRIILFSPPSLHTNAETRNLADVMNRTHNVRTRTSDMLSRKRKPGNDEGKRRDLVDFGIFGKGRRGAQVSRDCDLRTHEKGTFLASVCQDLQQIAIERAKLRVEASDVEMQTHLPLPLEGDNQTVHEMPRARYVPPKPINFDRVPVHVDDDIGFPF